MGTRADTRTNRDLRARTSPRAGYPELPPVRPRRGPRRGHAALSVIRVGLPVLVIVVVGVGAVMMLTGRANLLLAARGSRTAGATAASAPAAGEGTAPAAGGTVSGATFASYPGQQGGPVTVNAIAAAGGDQVAAGSAGGAPAIWRRGTGGAWSLAGGTADGVLPGRTGTEAIAAEAHGPAGWLAVGDVVSGAPQHPVVVTSADGGATWQAADGTAAFAGGGTYVHGAAASGDGYVIVGRSMNGNRVVAATWWSASLGGWTRGGNGGLDGRLMPSAMAAVTAGPDGFVAVGTRGPGAALWTSPDGRQWAVTNVPAPAGASGAALRQVAANGDRVVATGDAVTAGGTVPFAVVSADGGRTWQEVSLPATGSQTAVTALAAPGAGFTAAGQSGPAGSRAAVIWTSANGTTWTPARPVGAGVREITALAPSGGTVTGIGFAGAQPAAHPVLWTAPAP